MGITLNTGDRLYCIKDFEITVPWKTKYKKDIFYEIEAVDYESCQVSVNGIHFIYGDEETHIIYEHINKYFITEKQLLNKKLKKIKNIIF